MSSLFRVKDTESDNDAPENKQVKTASAIHRRAVVRAAICSEIIEKGRKLAAFLDARDVEHLRSAERDVEWKTGKPDEAVEQN